ncbi:MAG: hypothetical protein GY759_17325 [Chloroflexi bacterium]|nr:hypothetical protein [Chloroflexota bacterium]
MTPSSLLLSGAVILTALLAIVWWLRHSLRGLDRVIAAIPLAFAISYLSSFLFRAPDYQAGCEGICPGWWGYPLATHVNDGIGTPKFAPAGFILNAGIYYTAILVFSAIIVLLAEWLHWSERRRRWRIGFVLAAVLVPLALLPTFAPARQPQLSGTYQRLAINAERAWRWQLQSNRFSDRRLVVEDVRLHPNGELHRICFRAYTWFYLPHDKIYVDLEPTGVRAAGGGVIPLSESCWVQP